MIALFGLFAEVERDLISERTKEGLDAARAKGRRLGRPKGALGKSKLDGKQEEIRILLQKEVSKASIAKIVGVSRTALHHFINSRKLDPNPHISPIRTRKGRPVWHKAFWNKRLTSQTETALMRTECNQVTFEFHGLLHRKVKARFDGGKITSDAGVLLLREVEKRTGLIDGLAQCFTDHRDQRLIEHTVKELLGQRVYGLCLGYEDLNDHDQLRTDPMLAVAVEKADPLGESRRQAGDRGKALASKCTLNRLELSGAEADGQERYKKIVMDEDRIESWMVDAFLAAHDTAPEEIVLDMDATDDPIHGQQEGRFFHGYYRRYCYLPLYIFCGEHLLCARLRRSNIDGADGAVDELKRIIGQIRHGWPEVSIIIRADSGFCRDELLRWCEAHQLDYVIGLAKNDRLKREIAEEMTQAEAEFNTTGKPARVFKDFQYRTLKSWSCTRRVVAKAEFLDKGANPRFVVTSLPTKRLAAQAL